MSSDARQQLLATILPALVTGVFYFTFVALPAMRSGPASAEPSSDPAVVAAEVEREDLARRRQLSEIEKRLAAYEEKKKETLAPLATPRSERLAKLAELVERSGLQLDRETDVLKPTDSLPPCLAQISRWHASAASHAGAKRPSRELLVRGRFSQVSTFLRDLQKETDLFVIGLELREQKSSEKGTGRHWAIVVWG